MPLDSIQIIKLKQVMLSQLGKPYKFGVEVNLDDKSPEAFDCSEFVEWCYHQIGIVVPDGSQNQYEASTHTDKPVAGDVGFFKHRNAPNVHHVGMIFDDNTVIEARGEPLNRVITRSRKVWETWPDFVGWNRFNVIG